MEHMTERKFRREESNPIVKEDKAVLENYTLGASRAVLKLFLMITRGRLLSGYGMMKLLLAMRTRYSLLCLENHIL